jgi:hypothetical protein
MKLSGGLGRSFQVGSLRGGGRAEVFFDDLCSKCKLIAWLH